jgi:hypothetical protein
MPAAETAKSPMVVIDLGRQNRKKVKRLRKGEGPLMDDLTQAIQELKSTGKLGASATPVVVLVEKKPSSLFGL